MLELIDILLGPEPEAPMVHADTPLVVGLLPELLVRLLPPDRRPPADVVVVKLEVASHVSMRSPSRSTRRNEALD